MTLHNFAQFEFLEQKVLELFVLDQLGEGEVRLQTLQDQGLVVGCLFLRDLDEVFIDLAVVDGPQRSHLPTLPLALVLAPAYLLETLLTLYVFEAEVDERTQQSVVLAFQILHPFYRMR